MRWLGQVISNVLKSPQRRPLLAWPTRFDDDEPGMHVAETVSRSRNGRWGLTSVFPADDNTLSSQRTYAVRRPPAPDVRVSERLRPY